MTTIPVSRLPQSTTPPSGGSTPRLPLTPNAQKVFSERMIPKKHLVSLGSVATVTVPLETRSPRTAPASGTATPGSGTPTERTPRDTPPWTPRLDRVPRSMSMGQRIEISGARRSASPRKPIRPAAIASSGKEQLAESRPSASEESPLAASPQEQSPKFKVPEKRSPRKNTGITLGRSSRGMARPQDTKLMLEPNQGNQPAPEKRDIVKERIRQFEEQAQLSSKVTAHLTNINRQPARRTRSDQAGSPITTKSVRRAPAAEAAEKPQSILRKPDNFS